MGGRFNFVQVSLTFMKKIHKLPQKWKRNFDELCPKSPSLFSNFHRIWDIIYRLLFIPLTQLNHRRRPRKEAKDCFELIREQFRIQSKNRGEITM